MSDGSSVGASAAEVRSGGTIIETTRISGMIARAVEAEREACARVLDAMAEEEHRIAGAAFGTESEKLAMLAMITARDGAAAIRARGGA